MAVLYFHQLEVVYVIEKVSSAAPPEASLTVASSGTLAGFSVSEGSTIFT